jgi:hypothetical protein
MFLGTPSRSCIASPPRQGGLGDVFRYTIKELHSIATPYATSNKATELHPAQGSREVTLCSGKETSSDVDIHSAKEGAKAARWGASNIPMRPQPWPTMMMGKQAALVGEGGGITTVVRSDKHQARPPTYHFKRLLEEACPNHVYLIRDKLKDCNMMKSFVILGSLTWGTELDEDLGCSDTKPFPGEDVVMTVYGGCLHQGGIACLP